MDRQIIYPGAIPLETDLLNTNKYALIGLAKLASSIMGESTYLRGLQCTPTSPASMTVNIAKGEIYSLQNVDGTAYSSLAADTTNTLLKQGIILAPTPLILTAPSTAGQSINYLVQVTYTDVDSGATVLPYYNAANPSVAYSGPNNAGTAQNTVRSGVCTVALKAGVAATTGTQTTPSVDTGYIAAWVITVAQGATTVTASNISLAANAPFLPAGGLVDGIQKNSMTYAADTGAANAYIASYAPSLPTLIDGMRLTFKAKTANTGASTFAPNGNTAYPIYSHANQALQGGEIIANGLIEVEWNSSLTAWILCGNSGGATPVAAATKSNHAVQLSQVAGRLLNVQSFSASATYTPTAGATKIKIRAWSAGGGGAGTSTANSGAASGAAGGYFEGYFAAPTTATIVVGTGGVAVAANATTAGGNGGATTISSPAISITGGGGGTISGAALPSGGIATAPSTGTILSVQGQAGQGSTTTALGGNGGGAYSSYGGLPHVGAAGDIGGFPGGGGAGASYSTTARASGAGANGMVIIEEYA